MNAIIQIILVKRIFIFVLFFYINSLNVSNKIFILSQNQLLRRQNGYYL